MVGRLHPIELEYRLTMAQKLKQIAVIVIGWVFLLLDSRPVFAYSAGRFVHSDG